MQTKRLATYVCCLALCITMSAQTEFTKPTRVYLIHSSGNHLKMASDYGGVLPPTLNVLRSFPTARDSTASRPTEHPGFWLC